MVHILKTLKKKIQGSSDVGPSTKVNNISKCINSIGSQTRNAFLSSDWNKTDHHLIGSLYEICKN